MKWLCWLGFHKTKQVYRGFNSDRFHALSLEGRIGLMMAGSYLRGSEIWIPSKQTPCYRCGKKVHS